MSLTRAIQVVIVVATVLCSIAESRGQTPGDPLALTETLPHGRRKNRYISWNPNKAENDGLNIAFKVQLKSITQGSCSDATGGEFDFCREDRGSNDCGSCVGGDGGTCITTPIHCSTGGGTCMSTGATCVNDAPHSGGSSVGLIWWLGPEVNGVHRLVSEPFRKVITNWPNPTHAGDCEVVPQARYGIRAVEAGSGTGSNELIVSTTALKRCNGLSANPLCNVAADCAPGQTCSYASTPTPFWWGDAVGATSRRCNGDLGQPTCNDSSDCGGDPCIRVWGLPNGIVNLETFAIAELIGGIQSLDPSNLNLLPEINWLDFGPETPDHVVNFLDWALARQGFGGFPYPHRDPADCPTSQPECGNGVEEPGEQCDDGDLEPGDGCDSYCRIEGDGTLGFAWLPVDSDADYVISGNGITIQSGAAAIVELELRISGWSQAPGTPRLSVYQATLDPSSLLGADPDNMANATTPGVDLSLLNNQPWKTNPGGHGLHDGAFVVRKTCLQIPGFNDTGINCESEPNFEWDPCPSGTFCLSKQDFVMADNAAGIGVSVATEEVLWGAVSSSGDCTEDDGTTSYYAGTLVLNIPGDATGTYTIDFNPEPPKSLLHDCGLEALPGISYTPATITIEQCTVDAECDDGSVCTDDSCNLSTCFNVPLYDPLAECCNPQSGNLTIIDDGDVCTDDICNDATGGVTHVPTSVTQPDCNGNGKWDTCDIQDCPPGDLACSDCNENGVPDSCDIAGGFSPDANGNGRPDECGAGACCTPEGTCVDDATTVVCQSHQGAPLGEGTLCSQSFCPAVPGACCETGGGCSDVTSIACKATSDSGWAGPGTFCTDSFDPAETSGVNCGDGYDNDCDGFTDCADADCGGICSIPQATPLTAPFPHERRKNRYIAFDPNKAENDGTDVAFKVELKSIHMGSCDDITGGRQDFCRVDRGADDCNSCVGGLGGACITTPIHCSTGGGVCTSTGATCENDLPFFGGSNVGKLWWVGPEHPSGNGVHLMVSQPFRKISDDWRNPTHVGDCEVVPQAVYGVRAVDVLTAAESDEVIVGTTAFRRCNGIGSKPLCNVDSDCAAGETCAPVFSTAPFWWTDATGVLASYCNGDYRQSTCTSPTHCGGDPCLRTWTPPNGTANFDDINAALALVAPPGVGVPPEMTWVDMHPVGGGTPPNGLLNSADLQQMFFGFGGFPYTGYDPADCPDVGEWP